MKLSHSQITKWRQCQKAWDYRYGQKLVPKRAERPLYVGTWVHSLLEAHYKGEDWKKAHAVYVRQYNKLFEEEQRQLDRGSSKKKNDDDLESLPSQVERIMASYLWYHRHENAETLATEVRFELPIENPDGVKYILVGVIDRIKRDADGLIVIEDHKVWGDLPDESAFHTMDPQLSIYLMGAEQVLGIQADAIEYNYIRSVAPTMPSLNKPERKRDADGKLIKPPEYEPPELSAKEISTDYPTLFTFLKKNGKDPANYKGVLAPLAASSPFLKRYRMHRSDIVTAKILRDMNASAREIINHGEPVRNITKQCDWCPYQQLCRGELYDLDMSYLKRDRFTIESKRPVREAV